MNDFEMGGSPRPPLFVAIDTTDLHTASRLAGEIGPHVSGLKLGLEFFNRHGHSGVVGVAGQHALFLDLKLHDIPNTVAGAIRAVAPFRPFCLTVHASGGKAMMQAARDAARAAADEIDSDPMRLLGVTVLTSLEASDLDTVGQRGPIADQVARLTDLALQSGLAGVVSSPHEVALLRRRFGNEMMIVVPGIRPATADIGDQKRVMSPAQAMAAGASYLVIGRPITSDPNPAEAAKRIAAELNH